MKALAVLCEARAWVPIRCLLCPASFPAAPIGADPGPSHMDPDEEAGTAASLDHIIGRLESLEAADQLRNVSVLPVVVNVRSFVHRVVGDPSKSAMSASMCSVDCGICLCRFVPRATHP